MKRNKKKKNISGYYWNGSKHIVLYDRYVK